MEEGGIIVFDELNTGHPSVIALLNSVLDDRRRIQVPGYGLVKAHPNFRVFMTMNRDYQGTFEMNEATESRFAPIVFREPESIVDIIKKNVPAADPSLINKCDKIYREIKKKVRDGRLQARSVNIRGFINACKQSLWDINHKTALINNVANSCPDLSDREAIAQLIDLIEG
jgi:MoxR-like ATPase